MRGRHEAPTSAPEDGTVLHIPSDVIEEAQEEIKTRVTRWLMIDPVRVHRTVGGVEYVWTFDRITLSSVGFGDQTGIVAERQR